VTALTFGSYFSGGGLADVGAVQAGFTAVFAVEGDPGNWAQSMRIADAYEANLGAHVVRKAVQDVDPATLPAVDWFHASPVCKNASVANQNAGEKDVDIVTAQATAAYIAEHRPRFVTIENVWGYRKFEAWHLIARELTAQGYQFRVDHINMADYGVPQTRQRMWVTAVLNGNRLGLLPQTHEKEPMPSLFGQGLPRWVSWYEAIADLIPTLPDTEFAPWQLSRLPEMAQSTMVSQGKFDEAMVCAEVVRPAHTVTANHNQLGLKAFLAPGANATSFSVRTDGEPSRVVGDVWRVGNLPRAFLVNGTPNDYGSTVTVNDEGEPAFTQVASSHKKPARAFVMQAANPNSNEARKYRLDDEPNRTITASDSLGIRAFVVNESSTMEVRPVDSPAATQVASQRNGNQRAHLYGRVVKLTPRAIARLQTLPDWYNLPPNDRDAVALLGNGVPCRFAYVNGVRFCELAQGDMA